MTSNLRDSQVQIIAELGQDNVIQAFRRLVMPFRITRNVLKVDEVLRQVKAAPWQPEKMAEALTHDNLVFAFHPDSKQLMSVEYMPYQLLGTDVWNVAYSRFKLRGRLMGMAEIINSVCDILNRYLTIDDPIKEIKEFEVRI